MTRKHTPEPWFLDTSLHIYGTNVPRPLDGWSGGAIIEHPHVCTAKTIGDARLIAAAPELLVALRDLELGANTVVCCYDRNPGNFAAALADLKRYAVRARTAIARVKCDVPETDADADGWVEWNGGECPLPGETLVGVRFECGDVNQCAEAGQWDWAHSDATGYDIVAYRVVQGGAS